MHFLNCSHSHRYHDRKQVVICAQLKKKSLIMKKIYELTTGRALKYFLQHDSYTTLELPSYVDFSSLLEEINSAIDEGKINFQPDSKSLMGKNIN
ncbi:RNA-directed DNA polymerase, partial [Klebsiella pneumoniae]